MEILIQIGSVLTPPAILRAECNSASVARRQIAADEEEAKER